MPEYIKKDPELMKLINEIKEADPADGGSGAFYIYSGIECFRIPKSLDV